MFTLTLNMRSYVCVCFFFPSTPSFFLNVTVCLSLLRFPFLFRCALPPCTSEFSLSSSGAHFPPCTSAFSAWRLHSPHPPPFLCTFCCGVVLSLSLFLSLCLSLSFSFSLFLLLSLFFPLLNRLCSVLGARQFYGERLKAVAT